MRWQWSLGGPMKKRVEFDAHKVVKKPAKVAFKTKSGEKIRFTAEKPTKVPVHVSFKAKRKD
jgi:hypothetical protein